VCVCVCVETPTFLLRGRQEHDGHVEAPHTRQAPEDLQRDDRRFVPAGEGRESGVRGASEGRESGVRGASEGRERGVRGASEGRQRGVRGASEGRESGVRGVRAASEGRQRGVRGSSEGRQRRRSTPSSLTSCRSRAARSAAGSGAPAPASCGRCQRRPRV